jgi:lactoylglutathione lyase
VFYDARVTRYLHTMYRITDPERSRAFYEALGLEFRRDMDIVRGGEKEATNYFFGVPGQDEELELTFNHDGRTYDLGTGFGHIALAIDDLDDTLTQLEEQGIEPEREPYRVREGGSRICFVQDPDRMRVAGARAIGDFFASVPQGGRLEEIRLVPTSANRQPALAAYSRSDDGKHRPYGLMVLQIEGDLIAGIVGFPDPWLFEQCGLPSEL